jgi:hypothetical protein
VSSPTLTRSISRSPVTPVLRTSAGAVCAFCDETRCCFLADGSCSRCELPPPKFSRRDGGLDPLNGRVITVFDLEPHPRRSCSVGRICTLRNDALQAKATSVREYLCTVALQMLDELNAIIAPRQKLAKPFLPLDERLVAKVVAIDLQHVERQ